LSFCNPLKKALAERIVLKELAADSIRILQQLWHKMQVCRFTEELCQAPKLNICLYLFKRSLRETNLICFVFVVRPIEQDLAIPNDLLPRNNCTLRALPFWSKAENVPPCRRLVLSASRKLNFNTNFWITPSVETAQLLDSPSIMDCLLQASSMRLTHIPKETEDIEEV